MRRIKTVATKFAHYWLPALLWVGIVLLASTDTFSARNTGSILEAVATRLFGPLSRHTFETMHLLVRKAAHLTEYALLGVLWFRAWRGDRGGHQWRWTALTLLIVLATAITDEIHQSFVPSRSGNLHDVLLDFMGALAAQLVLWVLVAQRRNVGPAL